MTENNRPCSDGSQNHDFFSNGDCKFCGYFPDRIDPEIDPTVKMDGMIDPSTGKYFERIHISANFTFKPASDPSLEDDSYESRFYPSIHIQAGENYFMACQWLEKEGVLKFSPAHRTLQAAAAEAMELCNELLPGH